MVLWFYNIALSWHADSGQLYVTIELGGDPVWVWGVCCVPELTHSVFWLDVVGFFYLLLDRACFCVIFSVYGCMLCLVRYLFVISTSAIDCLGRFVPEMTFMCGVGR